MAFIAAALRLALDPDDTLNRAVYNHYLGRDFDRELPDGERSFFRSIRLLSPEEAFERIVMEHALEGTGLQKDILSLWDELEEGKTVEAMLANDADHLDLILSLKEEEDMGNPYASKWLSNATKRLCTKEGQDLARAIMARDHTAWWVLEQEDTWWQHRGKTGKSRPKPSCGATS